MPSRGLGAHGWEGVCRGNTTRGLPDRARVLNNWRNEPRRSTIRLRSSVFNPGNLSLLDNVWCTSYPRCALLGCCELYPFCHRPSHLPFGQPPRGGTLRTDTAGHPRFTLHQTKHSLERGIARLRFTQPKHFQELSLRSEFRVLYLVQGAGAASLPAEYEVLSQPGSVRHFMFSAFKHDAPNVTFYPRSNIGEARNMLYLMAREQENRQGWLYNYVIMLDGTAKQGPP